MKPSEHAIEDWAKMVSSKPQRLLTKEESEGLIKMFFIQSDIDSDPEILDMLNKKEG